MMMMVMMTMMVVQFLRLHIGFDQPGRGNRLHIASTLREEARELS